MNVMISGVGVISGAGVGENALFTDGRPCDSNHVTIAQQNPPANAPHEIVCAKDFDPAALLGKKGLQFLTRSTQLLVAAAYQAIEQSAFNLARDGGELGLAIGTNFANLSTLATYDWTVVSEGPSSVSAMDVPNTLANAPASYLAIRLGAKRHNTTISTGHCASLDAIGYAAQFLVQGRADAVLAGGTEEINPHVLWQLDAAGPQAAGKIPGEAAAVMLLQAEHASDAAKQHSHLARFGAWTNMLAPRSSPESLVQDVCCEALELAGLSPDKIRLTGLSASTPADLPVAEGISKALRNGHTASPRRVPAFSLQGLVGETLGTAGAVHAVAAVHSFCHKQMPASPGMEPGLWPPELEFVSEPREFDPGPALIVEWDPSGFASALVLFPAN